MSNVITATLGSVRRKVESFFPASYDIPANLTPVRFMEDTSGTGRRLNLLIPNIERSMMYGGQKTAFNFFVEILDHFDGAARILVDSKYSDEELSKIKAQYPDWTIVDSGRPSDAQRQIVCIDANTRDRALPIREFDYFIYTYWTTAYSFKDYYHFQERTFGTGTPHIHLIQDFEPGFNAWSTDYMLADSVYHQPRTIAVYNSIELKDWFDRLGYEFESSYVFSPKLDPDIAKHLDDIPQNNKRENLLIFYGRPGVPRNCFTLIINAINLLLEQHPEVSKDWKILSIGSSIGRIKLSNGQELQTAGKMTLDDYAALMHKAKIGISLMCSPHPSYPPLEMAVFGIHTITNSFITKNLSDVPHITSLSSVTCQGLADAIWDAMAKPSSETASTSAMPERYSHYLHYTDFYDGIIQPVAQELIKDANSR